MPSSPDRVGTAATVLDSVFRHLRPPGERTTETLLADIRRNDRPLLVTTAHDTAGWLLLYRVLARLHREPTPDLRPLLFAGPVPGAAPSWISVTDALARALRRQEAVDRAFRALSPAHPPDANPLAAPDGPDDAGRIDLRSLLLGLRRRAGDRRLVLLLPGFDACPDLTELLRESLSTGAVKVVLATHRVRSVVFPADVAGDLGLGLVPPPDPATDAPAGHAPDRAADAMRADTLHLVRLQTLKKLKMLRLLDGADAALGGRLPLDREVKLAIARRAVGSDVVARLLLERRLSLGAPDRLMTEGRRFHDAFWPLLAGGA